MCTSTINTKLQLIAFVSYLCCSVLIAAQSQGAPLPPALPLGHLVPRIEQDNFQLIPEGNQYKLNIEVPYGNRREETVTLLDDKELSVNGQLSYVFGRYTYNAVYVADGNGYRVKYVLTPLQFSVTASANLLKSAAG